MLIFVKIESLEEVVGRNVHAVTGSIDIVIMKHVSDLEDRTDRSCQFPPLFVFRHIELHIHEYHGNYNLEASIYLSTSPEFCPVISPHLATWLVNVRFKEVVRDMEAPITNGPTIEKLVHGVSTCVKSTDTYSKCQKIWSYI